MKAYLQFSPGSGGPYSPCGVKRTRQRFYSVERMIEQKQDGDPEQVSYRVRIEETVRQLHGNFLSRTTWYFRLQYPDDAQVAYLGEIPYQISFDALLDRNSIIYYKINLEFITTALIDPDPYIFDDNIYAGDDAAFA